METDRSTDDDYAEQWRARGEFSRDSGEVAGGATGAMRLYPLLLPCLPPRAVN